MSTKQGKTIQRSYSSQVAISSPQNVITCQTSLVRGTIKNPRQKCNQLPRKVKRRPYGKDQHLRHAKRCVGKSGVQFHPHSNHYSHALRQGALVCLFFLLFCRLNTGESINNSTKLMNGPLRYNCRPRPLQPLMAEHYKGSFTKPKVG